MDCGRLPNVSPDWLTATYSLWARARAPRADRQRGAVTQPGPPLPIAVAGVIEVPKSEPELDALLMNVPLQLLAYHVALAKGCEIDQPRNLAKSVTVE